MVFVIDQVDAATHTKFFDFIIVLKEEWIVDHAKVLDHASPMLVHVVIN